MVRIPLDVNYLRRHILRAITDGVNNHSAGHGTVRTRRTRFTRPFDLQRPQLRKRRLQVKPKDRRSGTTDGANFQEISTGRMHRASMPLSREVTRVDTYFLFRS